MPTAVTTITGDHSGTFVTRRTVTGRTTELRTPAFAVDEAPDDVYHENEFDVAFTSSDDVCSILMIWTIVTGTTQRPKRSLRSWPPPLTKDAFSDPFDRVDFWVQDVNGDLLAARVGYIRR